MPFPKFGGITFHFVLSYPYLRDCRELVCDHEHMCARLEKICEKKKRKKKYGCCALKEKLEKERRKREVKGAGKWVIIVQFDLRKMQALAASG